MLCKQCGADNAINRLFCTQCGVELPHDLANIQAAVDQEIRRDKAKATTFSIRWLLGLSFVILVVGILFRNSYKDLPTNDIVPFLPPPNVQVPDPGTAATTLIGFPLPLVRPAAQPLPPMRDNLFQAQVNQEAYARAAVTVVLKNNKQHTGLLIGDLAFYVPIAGQDAPRAIHIADLTHLRPIDAKLWEIAARGLGKPVQTPVPDADTLEFPMLDCAPDGKSTAIRIAFRHIQEIKPFERPKPAK